MRVIIVEDQQLQADNLKRALELQGFAVDWLSNPEEAKTRILLYRDEYSVILLDLALGHGESEGMELLKSVRAEGVVTPIIILSGQGETERKIELLENGADDYVTKPYSPSELIARINSVLRRPVVTEKIVRILGSLKIETAEHRVFLDDVEVALTLKEYALLECFAQRPNEVLKREDLYDQVWDFNSFNRSNVVDVHMKNLRNKLERDGSTLRFETVRGVGYRLVT